jgi:filamentous hemagglutinin family protein
MWTTHGYRYRSLNKQSVLQRWVIFGLGLTGTLALSSHPVLAQITPDATLGTEGSIVTPNVNVRGLPADQINGGATRGINLFHSFSEFNVGNNQRVYFANPTGIENILTRVTGGNLSNILGTLGVDGSASLFLLNPNGIIFGPNATLDIAGSFVASTADSVVFDNGFTFSATNPSAPPLLTIRVPLGLQYGSQTPTAVTNQGTLAVGQDLTLSGGSVVSTGELAALTGKLTVEAVAGDVQVQNATAQTATLSASGNLILEESQLQTSGNLNLLAQDTVRVRDTIANPFIAQAGGSLVVEGEQGIDIFALNHPSSGFFSGGDIVLRSANTVQGDAHYAAGGNFRIETLNGTLGKLSSPNDPIIRASGDVSFDSYNGASLHIFAGGSVTIPGKVTITGPDTTNFVNETIEIVERIPVAGGTTTPRVNPVSINGSTRPTLDIRAGTTTIGTPGITPNLIPGMTGTPNTNAPVTNANITIGDIVIAAPNGMVVLTNQYNPNPNQLPGNITVDSINTSSATGNGGSVFIDSRGNISLNKFINTTSNYASIAGVDTELFLFDSSGDILANNDDSSTTRGAAGSTNSLDSYINYTFNESGNYVLGVGAYNSYDQVNSNGENIGGSALATGSYTLQVSLENHALGTTGTLAESEPNDSRISPQNINSSFTLTANPDIENATTTPHISINGTGDGSFDYYSFTAQSGSQGIFDIDGTVSSGNAGNILLNAGESISLTGSRISSSATLTGGKGGNITLTGKSVSLTNGAALEARTSSSSNAGNIEINALNSVLISGYNPLTGSPTEVSTSTDRPNSGRGGDITVNVPNGNLTVSNRALLNATTRSSAEGGDITINVKTLDVLRGGQILTTTYGSGNAGNITINATDQVTISERVPEFTPPASPFSTVPTNASLTPLTPDQFNTGNNPDVESSTSIPFYSTGNVTGDGLFHYYSFDVALTGSLGIFDIDNTNLDTELFLFDYAGNLLANNDDSLTTSGAGGSTSYLNGSDYTLNSYIDYRFQSPGQYVIGVSQYPSSASTGTLMTGTPVAAGNNYTLQLSLEAPGTPPPSPARIPNSGLFAETQGNGTAGNITVNAGSINVSKEARINAGVSQSNVNTNIDTELFLFNSAGNLLASNDDSSIGSGAAGSTRSLDSYINYTFNQNDTYVIGVGRFPSDASNGAITGSPLSEGNYALQVSIANHASNLQSGLNGTLPEIESQNNNSAFGDSWLTAQNIDNSFFLNPSAANSHVESSTTIPYVSILGTGDGTFDYYSFTATAGSRGIFDIDTDPSAITIGGQAGNILLDARGGITISNSTITNQVDGSPPNSAPGSIQIRGVSVDITDNTQINASTSGTGNAGYISITGENEGRVDVDSSTISTNAKAEATGEVGNISLSGGRVELSNNAEINASNAGSGLGQHHVSIEAINGLVILSNSSKINTAVELGSTGNGANIDISAGSVSLTGGSRLEALTRGLGAAGDIRVNASNQVDISGRGLDGLYSGLLTSSETTTSGLGGDITLGGLPDNPLDLLRVSDGAVLSARTLSSFDGGNISVNANQLEVLNGGQLITSTFNTGKAGKIYVNATQDITISGRNPNYPVTDTGNNTNQSVTLSEEEGNNSIAEAQRIPSSLFSYLPSSFSIQYDPNIQLSTDIPHVSLLGTGDGSFDYYSFDISSPQTRGIFDIDNTRVDGSNLATIDTQLFLFDNPTGNLLAQNDDYPISGGAGGSTSSLESYISYTFANPGTYTLGVGRYSSFANAGSITGTPLRTGDNYTLQISLDSRNVNPNQGANSGLFAQSEGAGTGGDLRLETGQLFVQNGGQVSAATLGTGQGGILDIVAHDLVDVSGSGSGLLAQSTGTGAAGDLQLSTSQLTIRDGAQATVSSTGTSTAGNLSITALSVFLDNQGTLSAETVSGGGGNINLQGLNTLQVNNSQISASTQNGIAGNLTVDARDSVLLSDAGRLSVEATGTGSAGRLTVNTGQLTLQQGAAISASNVSGIGGGDILLQNLNTLNVSNSQISASTQTGQAGNLSVDARDSVLLSDAGRLSVEATGTGFAGNLTVNTGQLTLQQGAEISASTVSGSGGDILLQNLNTLNVNNSQISASTQNGEGGNLSIDARDSVLLSGVGGLSVEATGTGSAGHLTVNTGQLTLQQGAEISASTVSGMGGDILLQNLNTLNLNNSQISASTQTGQAGNLNVYARDSVLLSGVGGLSVEATQGGTAGNLTVNTTGDLTIQDGANISVSSPLGQAGNLDISAHSLFLNQGTITAVTGKGQGEGGANITLRVPDLLFLQNESLISANALGSANGGNITIDTGFLIALPPKGPNGSDIVANAVFGNGGRVNLTAQGLLGIAFRPKQTPLNDITASSDFGFAGVVAINRLSLDPSQSLTSLPIDVIDPSGLIDRRCEADPRSDVNQFTITGRGGLPPNPNEPLGEEDALEDLGSPTARGNGKSRANSAVSTTSASSSPQRLMEAQGWILKPDGTVILTAEAPTAIPHQPWQLPPSCTLRKAVTTASPR